MAGWEKGLYQRGNVWYIDKIIGGRRIHESTGTTEKAKAQRKLAKFLEEDYDAREFGKRPERTFEQAAAHYLDVNHHKKSIHSDSHRLANLIAFPGLASTPLSKIHRGTFDDWVAHRLKEGKAAGTVNHGLKVVRQILNQAARDWRDENGLTWIAVAPKSLKRLSSQNNLRGVAERLNSGGIPREQFVSLFGNIVDALGIASTTLSYNSEVEE